MGGGAVFIIPLWEILHERRLCSFLVTRGVFISPSLDGGVIRFSGGTSVYHSPNHDISDSTKLISVSTGFIWNYQHDQQMN